jgi:hypothetical protein
VDRPRDYKTIENRSVFMVMDKTGPAQVQKMIIFSEKTKFGTLAKSVFVINRTVFLRAKTLQ